MKNILYLSGIELRSFGRPASSLFTTMTELSILYLGLCKANLRKSLVLRTYHCNRGTPIRSMLPIRFNFVRFAYCIHIHTLTLRVRKLDVTKSLIIFASRIRMELQFHPDPARKLSAYLYNIKHCCVYSEKLLMMDRGTDRNM